MRKDLIVLLIIFIISILGIYFLVAIDKGQSLASVSTAVAKILMKFQGLISKVFSSK